MFPANIEVIGLERHHDNLREAEHIRLIKLARAPQPGHRVDKRPVTWPAAIRSLSAVILRLLPAVIVQK